MVDRIKLLLFILEERESIQFLVGMRAGLVGYAANYSSAICSLSDLVGVPPCFLTLLHPNSLIPCNSAYVSTKDETEGSVFSPVEPIDVPPSELLAVPARAPEFSFL